MTNTPLNISSVLRGTIGFDQIEGLVKQALNSDLPSQNYPPYNLTRINDDEYRVTLAVAGFSLEDLNIEQEDTRLTISGSRANTDQGDDVTVLHRGISNRAFQRSFQLSDYVKVTEATLENGLLVVNLVRKVPKSARPRKIDIH